MCSFTRRCTNGGSSFPEPVIASTVLLPEGFDVEFRVIYSWRDRSERLGGMKTILPQLRDRTSILFYYEYILLQAAAMSTIAQVTSNSGL
jgi:hypothetical protein